MITAITGNTSPGVSALFNAAMPVIAVRSSIAIRSRIPHCPGVSTPGNGHPGCHGATRPVNPGCCLPARASGEIASISQKRAFSSWGERGISVAMLDV
jgi:hypothetical protein